MTIKASPNSLSLLEIATEFGGATTPISFADFYRGGTKVPSGTSAGASAFTTTPLAATTGQPIATSVPLQFSMFYGTSNIRITASAISYASHIVGGTNSVTVTFNTDGSISHSRTQSGTGGSETYTGPTAYLSSVAAGNGAKYQLQVNSVSESGSSPLSYPSAGFHNLGTAQSFTISSKNAADNSGSVNFSVTIQDVGATSSVTFTLSVQFASDGTTYPMNGQSITATDYGTGGATSSGGYITVHFNADGSITYNSPWDTYNPEDYGSPGATYSGPTQWAASSAAISGANYQLKWAMTAGSSHLESSAPPQNTWRNLGSGVVFTQDAIDDATDPSVSQKYITMTVYIGDTSGNVLSTGTMTLQASYPHEGT